MIQNKMSELKVMTHGVAIKIKSDPAYKFMETDCLLRLYREDGLTDKLEH